MGYLHIENLYKNQEILLFKRCFALEKIHGTSAHVSYKDGRLSFFSGGFSPDVFKSLFKDHEALKTGLANLGGPEATIYGEYYGGKIQGMKETYGTEYRFTAFDVQIGDRWLPVPVAAKVCSDLGIEFVDWKEISTDLVEIDAARDADSTQAIRNGIGPGKKREGVVLRPLIELQRNDGGRIISKHKRADFEERKTVQKVVDPALMKTISDAQAIADEWVHPMRLEHVLDKMPGADLGRMRAVLDAMVEDIQREAGAEVKWSREAMTAVSRKTAEMFKAWLNNKLKEKGNEES